MTNKGVAGTRRRGPKYGTRQKATPEQRSKFGNRKTPVDGIMFDSAKEARRYQQLRLEERGGAIRNLELQTRFPIFTHCADGVRFLKVADYVADFSYDRQTGPNEWTPIVEDVKGVQTDVFRLKRKLVEAQYGITISLT